MIKNFFQYLAAIATWDIISAAISLIITISIINYAIYLLKK